MLRLDEAHEPVVYLYQRCRITVVPIVLMQTVCARQNCAKHHEGHDPRTGPRSLEVRSSVDSFKLNIELCKYPLLAR